MTSSPLGEKSEPESLEDAQISEIVEREITTAVAAEDTVYVLSVRYRDDEYLSVHTTNEGAVARLRETATQWGVADALHTDELTHRIEQVPVETP